MRSAALAGTHRLDRVRSALRTSGIGEARRIVLKITRLNDEQPRPTIRLEGELLEPWINSVRESCTSCGNGARLDLSAVTFVDAAGIRLICELMDNGVSIDACSSYVSQLLLLTGRGRWRAVMKRAT